MTQTRSLALTFVALALTACGGPGYQPEAPSLLSSSSYSAPSSPSFSGPSSPSIPQHDTRGELVVRPDLVCVPFVLRLEGADAKTVLATLEKATQAVHERFGAATNGQAATTMLGANVAPEHSGKAKSDEPPKFVVTVDGSVEVPIAADANYWTRARLLASLVQASTEVKPLVPRAPEDQPQLDTAFGAPELKVKNPEVHRPELIKRWVERTRAFAKAAESDKAPLNLLNCEPPQAISQTPISLEQVGLSLPVQCRVDVARTSP
ncbi:MAG TPA: hypothetical protein PK156_19145 [Polyangium sp.]|nr:hypothetical protein [Polyangium sp.]